MEIDTVYEYPERRDVKNTTGSQTQSKGKRSKHKIKSTDGVVDNVVKGVTKFTYLF